MSQHGPRGDEPTPHSPLPVPRHRPVPHTEAAAWRRRRRSCWKTPSDEPAHLVRAALVCNPWRRILHDPGFLRRYREFHRAPPLLGFLHGGGDAYRFLPTASATFTPPALACELWWALDCRHGRVLIHSFGPMGISVWDPVAGVHQILPRPPIRYGDHNAAVLCASDGCGHLDCHGKPFIVVFVGTPDAATAAQVSVYTSKTGAWSTPTSIQLGDSSMVLTIPSTLARGALYFSLGNCIVGYDLQHGQAMPVIKLPSCFEDMGYTGDAILMVAEDGELGVASAQGHSIHLWSRRQATSSGVAEWVQCSVIGPDMLKTIAIDDPSTELSVVGFAEGTSTIFIRMNNRIFAFGLKSRQVRKVAESGDDFYVVFPYVSFYTPDHASAKLRM